MGTQNFDSFEGKFVRTYVEMDLEWMLEDTDWYQEYKKEKRDEQQTDTNDQVGIVMPRRKLEGYLTEDQQERAVINALDAEDSMEEIYADLRERLGAKHPLTSKAERARERVNNFRVRLINSLNGVDESSRDTELNLRGGARG